MNITEAHHVSLLLHLLDGTATADHDDIAEILTALADRAGKALQLTLRLDVPTAAATLARPRRPITVLLARDDTVCICEDEDVCHPDCPACVITSPLDDPINLRPVETVPDPARLLS